MTTKNSKEVAQAFQWIYENTPLNYPKTLIVDDGKEFYGDMTKLMEKHDVMIQHGDPSQHCSQGIVKRFNRTLVDRLFSYQYHKEFENPSKSNREWDSRLQNVVSALNNERTRLIGMKPVDVIKQTLVKQNSLNLLRIMKRNYSTLVLRLDIFTNLVSWRVEFIKVKEGNDLLVP